MAIKPIVLNDFEWWLNLGSISTIGDNQFTIAKNVYYNESKQIQTRRWYTKFWNALGSDKPITSYFFYQRDDNLKTYAMAHSWDGFYTYDETTGNRTEQEDWLHEYETLTWRTDFRTRRDYAVYKNIVYMCNGVDDYAYRDWTSYYKVWLEVTVDCTFDNTTNSVNKVAHWLVVWDQIRFRNGTWALPAGIEEDSYYYIIEKTDDSFNFSIDPYWDEFEFTDNWTDITSYKVLWAPRIRYINMNTDTLFGSGDDLNPSTLYYSDAAPEDWTSIDTNQLVVWWDELWRINWLNNFWQLIMAFKSNKIYSIDVAGESALPIDSQTWWFSDRTIANVWNSLVYLTERGVDTLRNRTGVDWVTAIESNPLDEDVRELTSKIEEQNLNCNAALYIKALNNYYITFDTNNDNVPDTTLVYNSLVWSRTQYDYPVVYDYGKYIDSEWNWKYLFASGATDQMYQMEYGYEDDGETISYELETKAFDFWEPGQFKTFSYVDLIVQKAKGSPLYINVNVDWNLVGWSQITNDSNTESSPVQSIWIDPIGLYPLTWDLVNNDIDMYRYILRVPLYATWPNISVNLNSNWWIWILEQMRIWVNGEPIDVFNYANIW